MCVCGGGWWWRMEKPLSLWETSVVSRENNLGRQTGEFR